jgi:hypothetical protein
MFVVEVNGTHEGKDEKILFPSVTQLEKDELDIRYWARRSCKVLSLTADQHHASASRCQGRQAYTGQDSQVAA